MIRLIFSKKTLFRTTESTELSKPDYQASPVRRRATVLRSPLLVQASFDFDGRQPPDPMSPPRTKYPASYREPPEVVPSKLLGVGAAGSSVKTLTQFFISSGKSRSRRPKRRFSWWRSHETGTKYIANFCIASSVTRFGEVWLTIKYFWPFWKRSLSIWHYFELFLAIFKWNWVNLHCCKWQNIEYTSSQCCPS